MPDEPQDNRTVEVFYSYAHEDEKLKEALLKHLANIERQGLIINWHDRMLKPGGEWAREIDRRIDTAAVILLLVSPDFMSSGYCNEVELKRAMERHEAGDARVIPVSLRPVDWKGAPFEKLQALPTDAKPVTTWKIRDEAFKNIAEGVRKVVEAIAAPPESKSLANIPRPPVVGFIARRDKEGRDIVGLLKDELAPDKNQLVALWGPGGTGKTTIAAEVVRGTDKTFKGRFVWASPLRRADFSSATLLDEMATQLGREDLRRLAPEPKAAQVAALVSEAPTLVILDNFETIAEEEQTRCLDFLTQSAACPVLITTRKFIDRDDVTNVELAAMEIDEAREFLRRLIERTPKSKNFVNLDHDDLIQRCEANPLLLQWVIRQVVLSKTPQTALDYLSKGEGAAAERVFTRSFNLPQLGDDGRAALLALSLFTPTASREALTEVAGFGNDLRRMDKAAEALSALWLVETTDGNERILLRGLTRELAKLQLLGGACAEEFQHRYVVYFLYYAKAHKKPTPENLNALEAEKGNLLAALDTASALQAWRTVTQLRITLGNFLRLRGYWDEAIRSGEQAETAARAANDEWSIAQIRGDSAMILISRGEYTAAKNVYMEVLPISRRVGGDNNVAVCLHQLGLIAQELGDLEDARKLYDESLEIKKRVGDQRAIAITTSALGNLLLEQGKLEESKAMYEENLAIRRKLAEYQGIAIVLNQLGIIARRQGHLEEARHLYNESLQIDKELGNQEGIATSLRNLGLLANLEGDKTDAVRLFRDAIRIYEKLGSPLAEVTRRTLATVERAPE